MLRTRWGNALDVTLHADPVARLEAVADRAELEHHLDFLTRLE